MIVVDDNSPDGTAQTAQSLKKKGFPVRTITRINERGLASATYRGIKEAKYDIVAVMDTDLQHNPAYLPQLLSAIESGADMAIGSRYTKGASFDNWPLTRKLISQTALLLTRSLTGVKDPLGEFFMLRKKVLEDVHFENIGCRVALEILVKGKYHRVDEIPIEFGHRQYGESKVLKITTVIQDTMLLLILYEYKMKAWLFGKQNLSFDLYKGPTIVQEQEQSHNV